MEEEEKIRKELEDRLKERAAITTGKSRITQEENRRYNNLGKVILELRKRLY